MVSARLIGEREREREGERRREGEEDKNGKLQHL